MWVDYFIRLTAMKTANASKSAAIASTKFVSFFILTYFMVRIIGSGKLSHDLPRVTNVSGANAVNLILRPIPYQALLQTKNHCRHVVGRNQDIKLKYHFQTETLPQI